MLVASIKSGVAQQISFEYDAAGNQTKREFICVGCTQFAPTSTSVNKVDYLSDASKPNLNTAYQKIIAYPNPTTEVLNLKWGIFRTYVTDVEVFSTTGVSVFKKKYRYEENEFNETIQFNKMPPGMYVVKVTFSDGKHDLIKIIKQ